MPQPEPSSPAATPRRFRWRRLVQYRLRTLLILTAVVAALFAWWSYKARQQQEAVTAIKKAGGWVTYDFEWTKGSTSIWKAEPAYWPAWLVNVLGVDCFADVYGIENRSIRYATNAASDIDDALLVKCRGLRALRTLSLPDTKITDAGLNNLEGHRALQSLDLQDTQITDVGLEHLSGLTNLKRLDLQNTKVTDAGIARLKQLLPNCEIRH